MPQPPASADVDADLAQYGRCTLDDDGCVTCGDNAVPVRVLSVTHEAPGGPVATCADRTGQTASFALAFTPDAQPGDVLMVHAGIALSNVKGQVPNAK